MQSAWLLNKLMNRLKNGLISALITGVLLSPAVAADDLSPYIAIDHVQLLVSDITKSNRFYATVFATESKSSKTDDSVWIRLGQGGLNLKPGSPGKAEYISLASRQFNRESVRKLLKQKGIIASKLKDSGLGVQDRNGINTHIGQLQRWQDLTRNMRQIPEADAGDPIFTPLLVDEIFIMVTNMEVDSLFYSRLLGRTGVLQAGSLWFELGNARLRIGQTPVGQAPGINYISVLVANTDLEAAAEAVFNAGGIIENLLPNGFSFWDPDGTRIVVRTTTMH